MEVLLQNGILSDIKVDLGAKALAGHPGEKITEGLDGLRDRFAEYAAMGARFAKWRAVIGLGEGIPSQIYIEANAHALGRYAALCQEAGLVLASSSRKRSWMWGMRLKPNMVVSGLYCPSRKARKSSLTRRCGASCGPSPPPFRGSFSYRADNPANRPRHV